MVAHTSHYDQFRMLNCLAAAIPGGDRIVSAEEVFELAVWSSMRALQDSQVVDRRRGVAGQSEHLWNDAPRAVRHIAEPSTGGQGPEVQPVINIVAPPPTAYPLANTVAQVRQIAGS